MKNARPVQNQPGANALPEQPNYTTRQLIAKALPFYGLLACVIILVEVVK